MHLCLCVGLLASLFSQRVEAEVCAVHDENCAKHTANNHKGHDTVRKEGEDALLNEEPVLLTGVDRIAKGGPNQNAQDEEEFLPKLAPLKLDQLQGEIQKAPGKQKTVVHKGLEDHVAEGRLSAKRSTGVAHPHKRGCNGHADDDRF